MLWHLVVLVITLWVVYVRHKRRRIIQLSNSLKNDFKALPLIGHSHLFFGSGEARMAAFQLFGRQAIKHGGMTNLWAAGHLYVVVADPEVLELVMKSTLEKDQIMQFARTLIGNGSIFAAVPIWRPRRKILAPTFSVKNLSQFMKVFSRQSSIMIEQLEKTAGNGPFSIWKYVTTYTMDSVCETTLGVRGNAQLQPDQPFLSAFERSCQLIAERMVQVWLYSNSVYMMLPAYREFMRTRKVIHEFINKVIAAKRKSLKEEENMNPSNQEQNEKFKTFLDLLIEFSGGSRGYSDLELQEETLMLMLAGTDTTAVGASFAATMLSKYPEVQEKLYQELREVFGDSDRPIVMEDLPRLKYLDAVIKETLRLYPPVPVVVRKVEKDIELPSGVTLVEGCGVLVHIWATHRNPQYWGDDAEVFRPERFIDSPPKHAAAFQAFSFGPRACIGYQYAMMSMKTLIASLVRKYRILPANTSSTSSDKSRDSPLRVAFNIMMKDVDNFTVQLRMRTS